MPPNPCLVLDEYNTGFVNCLVFCMRTDLIIIPCSQLWDSICVCHPNWPSQRRGVFALWSWHYWHRHISKYISISRCFWRWEKVGSLMLILLAGTYVQILHTNSLVTGADLIDGDWCPTLGWCNLSMDWDLSPNFSFCLWFGVLFCHSVFKWRKLALMLISMEELRSNFWCNLSGWLGLGSKCLPFIWS